MELGSKGEATWALVEEELLRQGFSIAENRLVYDPDESKEGLRQLHSMAVAHKRLDAERTLKRKEGKLLEFIANGKDLDIAGICPKLVEVKSGSFDELLFRYCSLHWSIPVSSGYGRRLRVLIKDSQNDKIIGLIGLADPVFSLSARDTFIGWTQAARMTKLRHVMDAFVVGAIPPYSHLLAGKFIASLLASSELSSMFKAKYQNSKSRIAETTFDGELALITTASALGKSSIYNRVTYKGNRILHPVGFTRGYGEFQFLNGTYEKMREYVQANCTPRMRHEKWGTGFRNRREVVIEFLHAVGKPDQLRKHMIKREVFACPLGQNTKEFLCGNVDSLIRNQPCAEELWESFCDRWMKDRPERIIQATEWDKESYRLW